MFWLCMFLQLWYWQCFQPDEWKGSHQHVVPTVNQLRIAKNARAIGFRGGSSWEWLQIGTQCELWALGDELKHICWSKLQDNVKIVWFEGIITCLCCCVMILVNLCHNGLSMMYAEVTHTRRPREPCNVSTLMFDANEKGWTNCFVGLNWSGDSNECLWDQNHIHWLGMCLTRRLRQGFESRAL